MHRFYSTNIDAGRGTAELDEAETRHLRDVLRIREGETVRLFDGVGHEFLVCVESISKRTTVLAIVKDIVPSSPESPLDLTLAVALTKGEKFELVIQKSVELGVNRIIPIVTQRCDIKPYSSGKRIERWKKIALEASKQCGRARLIEIDNISDFSTFLKVEFAGTRVLFSERDGDPADTISASDKILAAIGPEGGWEDSELSCAADARFQIITLGGRILRAETAAISIAAVLQHRFGDLN